MNNSNHATMSAIVDLIGIILCFLILIDFSFGYKTKKLYDDKIFNAMVLMTIFVFFFDAVAYLCDGISNIILVYINYISNVNYIIFNSIVSVTWILYLLFKLNYDKNVIKKWFPFIALPNLIVIILSISSFSNKLFFYIDADNNYIRGKYFFILSLAHALYVIVSLLFIVIRLKHSRSYEERHSAKVLLSFVTAPIVGLLAELISYGMNSVWIFTSISYLIIYFNIQNSKVNSDFLTGLFNRRKFHDYASKKILNRKKDNIIFLLIIDLNKFKSINDKFGHLVGDDALISFSKVLSKSVNKNDFVARIGGDEFVVLGERKEEHQIEESKTKLIEMVNLFNYTSNKVYELSISVGVGISQYHDDKKLEDLLTEADCEMYMAKLEYWKNEKIKSNDRRGEYRKGLKS